MSTAEAFVHNEQFARVNSVIRVSAAIIHSSIFVHTIKSCLVLGFEMGYE